MKVYSKTVDGHLEVKACNRIVIVKDGRRIFNPSEEEVLADGWEEYVPMIVESKPIVTENPIVTEAKEYLEATDYKVIKCMEASLCGEELPYDIMEIHREREERRKIINDQN